MGFFCNRAPNNTCFTGFCTISTSTPRKHRFLKRFYEPPSRKSWSDENLVFYDVFFCHISSHFTMPLGYFCEETFKRGDCSKFFATASGTISQKHMFYRVLCHAVNRLFLHQGTENVVFYEVLYNTVQKPCIFTQFPRGPFFLQRSLENTVFHEGLRHMVPKTSCFT